jgi:hypothetical protein
MVGKAQKSHGTRSGLYGRCSNWVPPIHFFQAEYRIQFKSRPVRFLGSSNHEEGAPRQVFKMWVEWSVVRCGSLAKGSTSKKKPSLHLHKVPAWNNEVGPRILPTALVHKRKEANLPLC